MARSKITPNYEWFKAKLTPMAHGIFTDAFYPDDNSVFVTKVDITSNVQKYIVTAKLHASGIRMMTGNMGERFLSNLTAVTKTEEKKLNELATGLRI